MWHGKQIEMLLIEVRKVKMELYGYEFIRESDLTHHGIKGQKWGVRRYQNEDGMLTDAGKKRYYAIEDKYRNKALRKGASRETAEAYGKAVSKQRQSYEKTTDSADRVNRTLGLSPKRWKTWANDYKTWRADKSTVRNLKQKIRDEKTENRVTQKYIKAGTSPEKSKEMGRLYIERKIANRNYSKAFDKVQNSFPVGKKHSQRVEAMVESLNDYWIADDNYRIAKIEAQAEARRSKGWR